MTRAGESPVPCQGADFRDPFNVSTLPACTPGMVRVSTATPLRRPSRGILRATYR